MPSRREIANRIKEVELFSNLRSFQLRDLAELVGEETFPEDEIVYHQGDFGTRYYIIEEGLLQVTHVDSDGRIHDMEQLGPGAAFGETSLLLGDLRDVTVRTLAPSMLLYIEKEDFDNFLKEYPDAERLLDMRPDIKERRNYPAFSWLEERELPVKVLHKHPAMLFTSLLTPVAVLVILFITTAVGVVQLGDWVLFVGLSLAVFPLLACIYFYIDWRNDIYVVTNRRVSHQERIGLFREQLSTAPLQKIENISRVREGPIAGILGFGDLIMEMTGEGGEVRFRNIPQPEKVEEIISTQLDRVRSGNRATERSTIYRAMRRHLLLDEPPTLIQDGEDKGESAQEDGQSAERMGCLMLVRRFFRYFLPSSWNRQGDTITWHKHWVALLQVTALPLGLFLIATGVVVVMVFLNPGLVADLLFPYGVALFVLTPWLIWQIEDWQNDFYQVTSTRLILVERLPFYLREERRESPLDRITNVRFDQAVIGKILGFGHVIVETAAVSGDFQLRFVSKPREVQREIFSHMEAFQRELQEQEAERRRRELLNWFGVYDEIRGRDDAPPE